MNEFTWALHKSGHHLVPQSCLAEFRPDDPWIRPRELSGRAGEGWRRYAPLRDTTALFRTFADVECDQESILRFANRFGLLTDPQNGEPVSAWTAAISDMRSAVESWEKVQRAELPVPSTGSKPVFGISGEGGAGKSALLPAKALHNSFEETTGATPPPGVGPDAECSQRSDVTLIILHGDVLEDLASKINQNIHHVRPVFVTNFDELLERVTLQLRPTSLLEAMWLQFGTAVATDKSFRKCRYCGEWFDLSPKAARIDKVFCTDSCKARAYRRRLAERDRKAQRPEALTDSSAQKIDVQQMEQV